LEYVPNQRLASDPIDHKEVVLKCLDRRVSRVTHPQLLEEFEVHLASHPKEEFEVHLASHPKEEFEVHWD
jgi:hypothetical protein